MKDLDERAMWCVVIAMAIAFFLVVIAKIGGMP